MSLRIAIVGDGKMGRAVAALATEHGHTIQTVITAAENAGGCAITKERLLGADVAVEFTNPAAAAANITALIEAGVPAVTGTTGWMPEMPRIQQLVTERRGALLHAANFSVGVHLFLRTAKELARAFANRPEFDAFILEEHHKAKADAPSGTGLLLQQRLTEGDGGEREFPITAVRAGWFPGTHEVAFDSAFETIRLSHAARSRQVFAAGALAAAAWLPGRIGVFTFEDMLFGSER